MKKSVETIRGDSEGIAYELPLYHIAGTAPDAPSAYIQAALYGDELPGVVAIYALMPKLREAESEGRVRGNLTIVPRANPIGANQLLFGASQGRFDLGTRVNYNRDFPLLDRPDVALLPGEDVPISSDKRPSPGRRCRRRVCAVAKKDLKPGDALDAIGEYTHRAWIMTAGEARAAKAIPCGLLQGGSVTAPIRKGELITTANAAVAPNSKIAELRARQDRLVYGAEA